MTAEHFRIVLCVIYYRSQRQIFKHFINLLKDTVWVTDILAQFLCTLISEAKVPVDCLVLMVASEQKYLLGIPDFQSHEQANDLQTVHAPIDVVPQKEIVEPRNISLLGGRLPNVEKSHQVDVGAVQIAKDLDGWLELSQNNRLGLDDLRALMGQLQNVFLLRLEFRVGGDVLAILYSHQGFQEKLREGFISIFSYVSLIFKLRS